MLDSDILFLKTPEELVEHLRSREPGQFVFERDMQHAYFASEGEIHDWFGVEVSPRANCGIMLADVSNFKYELLERWLSRGGFERHPWAEQTLWAMYAGRDRTVFWGKEYDVSASPEIDLSIVVKHYIKPIREFIYTSGIPHLRAKLEARGAFGR
jgi:hypothetical protein